MSLKIILQRYYVCKLKSTFNANKILNKKVCVGFCRTIMKLNGRFLCSRISSLVRGIFPIPGSSRIVRNNGSDLLSRWTFQFNCCHVTFLEMFFCLSLIYLVSSKLIFLRSCLRLLVAPDELGWMSNS